MQFKDSSFLGGALKMQELKIGHGRKSRGGKCGSGNIGSERIWKAGIVISAAAFVGGLSMHLCGV